MSYDGMYDPTPLPEPKKKPKMLVDLYCDEKVWGNPWWMSDPLYGGWKFPAFAWCPFHEKTEQVKKQSWPSELKYN